MIKTIIFDLDNTLMDWKSEYISALNNTLNRLNLSFDKNKILQIDELITDYENHHSIVDKKLLIDYINKRCNVKLPIEFSDILFEEQGNLYETFDKEKIDTLEYLSNKYNLIVLTNWVTSVQEKRLENAGILKYFSKVYGGDVQELKPSLKAFDVVDKKDECIMIGDSIKNDIEPALEVGMQAIVYLY